MMKDLGMIFLEDIKDARKMTHLICKEPLKRKPKVMIAMNVTQDILRYDWLIESDKKGKPVPCQDYIVEDSAAFCFSVSIPRATAFRKKHVAVLTGWSIAVCKGVAGKKAPALDELECMVKTAGAEWLGELTAKTLLRDSMIILTSSEKPTKAEEKQTKWFAENSNAHIAPISWLFDTLMSQQHNLGDA